MKKLVRIKPSNEKSIQASEVLTVSMSFGKAAQ